MKVYYIIDKKLIVFLSISFYLGELKNLGLLLSSQSSSVKDEGDFIEEDKFGWETIFEISTRVFCTTL